MANSATHDQIFRRLVDVRTQALEHARRARELATERRDLMKSLIDDGVSQAEIARRLGVSRQAVQKMLSV